MPMNPDVKTKWLAALRSGEYKQGQGTLKNGDEYCCLGVLCDLYRKVYPAASWRATQYDPNKEGFEDLSKDFGSGVLTRDVVDWAGLRHIYNGENPIFDKDLKLGLANYNDGNGTPAKDFLGIADLIKANL